MLKIIFYVFRYKYIDVKLFSALKKFQKNPKKFTETLSIALENFINPNYACANFLPKNIN
jgi:hypothetical protein